MAKRRSYEEVKKLVDSTLCYLRRGAYDNFEIVIGKLGPHHDVVKRCHTLKQVEDFFGWNSNEK